MSEKSIAGRAKETLRWIQREQRTNGLGMVKFAKVPDQGALRFLLRSGDVFEPQADMVKSAVDLEPEESTAEISNHPPWIWKTPKPKKKGDVPESYEFLPYPDWNVLPNAVAEALRNMGFSDAPYLYEGYSYRKMAGGTLRRKMIGSHSIEELLAELKLSCSKEEFAKLKLKIEDKVAKYRGKFKEFPTVEVNLGIVYYPKDGSFKFEEKT